MRQIWATAIVIGLAFPLLRAEAAVRENGPQSPDGLAVIDAGRERTVTRRAPGQDRPKRLASSDDDGAGQPKSPSSKNDFDFVCRTLQSAARQNDIPVSFLTRLIWQESRFDARAVSPAGARGVAQFMPGTAAYLGLADPFDVSDAINKSAGFLRDLNKEFGNLGLAAAAYNAGPGRVHDWLAGGGGLPGETRAYVTIVTGHGADEWRQASPSQWSLMLPESVPCPQLVKLLAEKPEPISSQGGSSTARASRNAINVAASTSTARSAMTFCISGCAISGFWNARRPLV